MSADKRKPGLRQQTELLIFSSPANCANKYEEDALPKCRHPSTGFQVLPACRQTPKSLCLLTFGVSTLCANRQPEVAGDLACNVHSDGAMCEMVRSRGPPRKHEPL